MKVDISVMKWAACGHVFPLLGCGVFPAEQLSDWIHPSFPCVVSKWVDDN